MNSDYVIPNFQSILDKILPRHRSGFGQETGDAPATFTRIVGDKTLTVQIIPVSANGKRITIVGMINGEIKANQSWNIGLRYAAKYGTLGGFIARDTVGVALAFDQLMSQIGG